MVCFFLLNFDKRVIFGTVRTICCHRCKIKDVGNRQFLYTSMFLLLGMDKRIHGK